MKFQNIILIFYLLTGNLDLSYSIVMKRSVSLKHKKCEISDLVIYDCDVQVSRYGNQKFKLKYNKTCNIKEVKYNYNFEKDSEYSLTIPKSESVISVSEMKKRLSREKKIFIPGTHFLVANMTAKSLKNKELSLTSNKCKFYVRNENASVEFEQLNRNVQSGKSFVVDASRSKNRDLERGYKGLEYKWSCTSTNSFCEKNPNLGTGQKVKVPAKYATQGDFFNFTVQVRSIPTDWQSAMQFITVDDNSPFSVFCQSSCGKYPNTFSPSLKGTVRVKCEFSCDKYTDGSKTLCKIIHGKKTLGFWANAQKSHVAPLAQLEGKTVTFQAAYKNNNKGSKIVGKTVFRVLDFPKLDNCRTIPPKGNPFTKFKVHCDYDEKTRKYFEVRVKSGETVVFSATSPKLEDIEFSVSSENATVVVKLEDTDDVFIEKQIPLQVEPLIKNHKNATSSVDHLTDIYEGKNKTGVSVSEMMKNGEHKEALQMINVVARELARIKVKNEDEAEAVKRLKKDLLDNISHIPINNIDMSKSVSGVMKLIAEDKKSNVSDSEMAKLFSETCSNIAKHQLNLVENDIDNSISEKDSAEMTNYLMSCSESEMSPYYEMFKDTAVDINFTTQFPINENLSEKNFEDYPQYVADDLIEQKVTDFLSAADSMVGICRDMASSMMYKLSIDMEQPENITRGTSMVSWMKSAGTNVSDSIFKLFDVTINPTPFLKGYPLVSMTVCSYKKDPFWSASESNRVPTNVVDVSLIDEYEDEPITDFKDQPMNISFKISGNLVHKKVSEVKVKVFNKYSEFREDEFTIVVIKARSQESFFIDFHDIGPNDHFQIVVIDMERPRLNHFDDPLHVNIFNKKFLIEHQAKSDKWFLLAIKPHITLGVQKDRVLNFSVYTPMCVSWNSNKNKWEFACSVYLTTTSEIIQCRCLHLSTLAGAFEYNELREHPKFLRPEFTLEDTGNLFLVVITCILLMIYFFLLLYAIQKNETIEDAVYLMSDVPAENRFLYLVIVKTGGKIHSGTSSLIVIQLFGKDNQSQEHIVNFPDPLEELLQARQEDYFVLATPVHLGKLEKIKVWFDCSGMRPTWYCQHIRICDLQTKKWYFFKIKKWFKIEGKPRIFMIVTPTDIKEDKKQDGKRYRLLRSFLNFGRFNKTMWQMSTSTENKNFGYPKRLTLILSIMLTILVLSIEFNGRPEILPRDSITPKCFFALDMDIFLKGIYCALITFFPHLGIMVGFKNSRLQFQSSRESKTLQPAFTIIFWCVLILNITLLLHYLLIYGYRVIQPKTLECIIASVFGFVFYVFILDFLHNFLAVLFGGPLEIVTYNYEKMLRNVEEQRRVLYEFLGSYIYRPILTPFYQIMSSADLMRKKIHFRQKRDMIWQIQDFFIVITFILMLYIIALGEKDSIYDYRGHIQAVNLTRGFKRNRNKLERITRMRDFENFTEKSLIPAIQSYQWYGQYVSKSPGTSSDASNKYMGVIRFRQHRVEDDSCVVLEQMRFLNVTCRAPNYFFHFDSYNYTPAWKTTIPEFHKSRLGYFWGHQYGVGRIFLGLTGYYESGGYVAELGRTIDNSYVNFNYLKRYNWIDPLTRAVVIEFCLYNVNLNLFHFVEIVLERSATGYINKDLSVQTERVTKHSSRGQKIALICSFFFMMLVLALAVRTFIRILKTNIWYKDDLWHIVDVIIIAVSLAWIGLFVERVVVLRDFAKHLEEKRSNVFVNYFPVLSITDWMKTLEALLICLSTLRMWRILRFGVTFRTVERTLLYSASSLFIMSFYYIIFLIGFGIPTYVILGSRVGQFKHPYYAFKTLILHSMELTHIDAQQIAENERGLGYVFYVLHFSYYKLFMTFFIAIILVEYRKAREFSLNEVLDYNLKDYTLDSYKILKRMTLLLARRFRLTAGGESSVEYVTVSPKEDDRRYKDCVKTSTNRMKAMACVAKCVLLKLQKGLRVDETDHALMLRTVNNLNNRDDDDEEFFFVETTRNAGFKVVDDRRLLMMEKIVKLMLETPEERAEKIQKMNQEEFLRAGNMSRMMRINYRLKLMCEVIKNIEVEISSNRNNF